MTRWPLSAPLLQLITSFLKRLYTDKIIIMFTFLVVCVIIGMVIYSKLNKKSSTFKTPDILTPPSV